MALCWFIYRVVSQINPKQHFSEHTISSSPHWSSPRIVPYIWNTAPYCTAPQCNALVQTVIAHWHSIKENRSDFKRRNIIGCLGQYTTTSCKYLKWEPPPHPRKYSISERSHTIGSRGWYHRKLPIHLRIDVSIKHFWTVKRVKHAINTVALLFYT